ncbi:MAG TPA: 4-hydroxyphenylacetate 3-hydroxylase N-terminal domain-containing protein [Micropepsaceae bacterium]|nr:4-hydroxyphenylacetate 3-hydroxylase N-terminal domain-containing protein [Micropepsaceae bacterium]
MNVVARGSKAKLRSGAEYLKSIKDDGRRVLFEGEPVRDVTSHPAFAGAARSLARLFDVAADPTNAGVMTYPSPKTGRPVWRCYQVPKTVEDLAARRRMSARWAEETFGLMGRTPDHVAGFLAGYAAKPSVFAELGGKQFADNVVRYYEHARDNSLYLSYAIVPPQIDRSRPAHKQSDPTLYAGVVKERDDGIVLKGAQQLATGAAFSDGVFISCIHPLSPGDEAYAFAVAVPSNAPGLKIYCRRPYAANATNAFDYPLSSRFDEIDALLVLDDVFVPWENVFCYRSLALCRDQWWKTPSHSYGNHQAQVRYCAKLKFLMGLTKRLVEITGVDPMPPVQIMLGEMAAFATIIEGMVLAQEIEATIDDEGAVWPSKAALYAVMALQGEINPRLNNTLRELAGGSIIMLPSSVKDFASAETAADIERYIASPGFSSKERVAILKLVWDFIGTEFAGRHEQYEKFYGGASFLVKQNMARAYDFASATAMVSRALSLPEE